MVIRDVERFVSQAIESILDQTFRDFEFIIVDFGSTDGSKHMAASYAAKDKRIQLTEIPRCSYIEAKISACSLVHGRYLAIQDADDVSLPHRLEAEVDFMENHPEVGLLGGAIQRIDQDGKCLSTADKYPADDQEIRSVLREWSPFCHPAVLILTEAFVRAGGYRVAFTQSDDYDLWLRISEHYRCANLQDVIVKYRIHPQQMTIRNRSDQILCTLAAQASASLRETGQPDPINSAKQITPALLTQMGVSKAKQKNKLAEGYLSLIRQMYAAGGYASVLEAAEELFRLCKGERVESKCASDIHILSAKVHWKQKRILPSFFSLARAVHARPKIVGRPLIPFLRRLRSAF